MNKEISYHVISSEVFRGATMCDCPVAPNFESPKVARDYFFFKVKL